jgi:hypothetical protein
MNRIRFSASILALFPLSAFAHHGQDYLVVESPTIPHPGNIYLLANAEAAKGGEIEFEPSLLWAVSPRVAFELHAHEMREPGEGWRYEATAPAVHVLLSDPAAHHGTRVGLSAEYEIAKDSDEADNLAVRLSVQKPAGAWTLAGNLIADHPDRERTQFGYAIGARRGLAERWTGTLEARGSFEHAEESELLAGLVWERGQSLGLKLGVGAERVEDGDYEPKLHLGLIVRLRGD